MVKRELSRQEKLVKVNLLNGQSMKKTAKNLRIPETTVRDISARLEYYGVLRRIPGKTNPVAFEEVKPASENHTLISAYDVKTEGCFISHGSEETRVHLNGFIGFGVIHEGRMEIIRNAMGEVLAEWTSISTPKGRIDYKGKLYAFGTDVTFAYRKGKNGNLSLAVWPQDMWVEAERNDHGETLLKDRAQFIADLLRKESNWRFSELELHGKFEYAHNNPLLARHFRGSSKDSNAEVKCDTSIGSVEVETFQPSDDKIVAYLPSHIREAWERMANIENTTSEIISKLTINNEVITKMSDCLDKIIIVQQNSTLALGNIAIHNLGMEGYQ